MITEKLFIMVKYCNQPNYQTLKEQLNQSGLVYGKLYLLLHNNSELLAILTRIKKVKDNSKNLQMPHLKVLVHRVLIIKSRIISHFS